ncbi:MAG TPA: molybdopterin-synthase adenylyltransferase MoeB [Steroidobacteraceae bacterium]|jgi:molybdopterin/thiamine biosynthesis adenylyltransferase/rhodanese-related sulfurtransferase|nr:molybdopterin-synthase adenylyltransferase MoeB [Steroidobacteraceae bacterium]
MALSPSELRRYSRHLSLAEIGVVGQEKLRTSSVLIVGAGGLGSPAALYLAAAGIGTLGVLDFDRVDESNLQRQVLFDTASVGQSKADSARYRLAALNPELRIVAHDVELRAANVQRLFADYDLIVDGTDRIATHYLVNDACVLFAKPLVTAAIYRFEGTIMSYLPDRGPCYRCLFPQIDETSAPNCAEVGVLGVLPGVLGTLQATEAVKLLLGIGEPLIGRLLTYDALELSFQELRFQRRADCAVCGGDPSITAPLDPPGFCSAEQLAAVRSIDAKQLARELTATAVRPQLIDVREPPEFAAGHLPGSINLPMSRIEREGMTLLDPQRVIFVCRSGVRSARAAALAAQAGLHGARQLAGGLLSYRDQIEPTLSVV